MASRPMVESDVTSEWLTVMLEEIARKRDDAARAHAEFERRRRAHEPLPPDEVAADAAGIAAPRIAP